MFAYVPSTRSEWAEWGASVWTTPLQTMLGVAVLALGVALLGPKQVRGMAGIVAGGTGVLICLRLVGVI